MIIKLLKHLIQSWVSKNSLSNLVVIMCVLFAVVIIVIKIFVAYFSHSKLTKKTSEVLKTIFYIR